MCALAPLNILVILNTHVPKALGDARLAEEDIKNQFQQSTDFDCYNCNANYDEVDEYHYDEQFNDNLPPSEALLKSLSIPRHLSGADNIRGIENGPFETNRGGLGAAARSPPSWSTTSSHHRYSPEGTPLGRVLLGAIGIAALGYRPMASASSSRVTATAIMGAVGVAAFNNDPGQPVSGTCTSHSGGNLDESPACTNDGHGFENNATPNSSGKNLSFDEHALKPVGLTIGGSTSSKSEPTDIPTCQCSCSAGSVIVPRHILEQAGLLAPELPSDGTKGAKAELTSNVGEPKEKQITLVMSRENVLALVVISLLSFLGAIYLFKMCTRKRCTCRLCQNQYRTQHLLGSGGYGSVYLVDRVSDGEQFVSKKIPVKNITEVDEYSLEAKELLTLRHKHIVSYEDDFVHVEYGTFEPKTYFVIIMEFCPEGDLKEKIELEFCSFTEDYVRTVFAQVLEAVQYLHSKNVIHRDLKSQNVFLALDGRVRLGDFGLCKHTQALHGVATKSLTHAGTDCYMAPEMMSSSKYGKPADMWSLGCMLYELVTGQFMWELEGMLGAMVMKDSQIVTKLLKVNLVPCVGATLTSLLKRLLSIRPEARPTVTTCMRKKLFKAGFRLSRTSFGDVLGEFDGDGASPEGSTPLGSPLVSIRGLEMYEKDSGDDSKQFDDGDDDDDVSDGAQSAELDEEETTAESPATAKRKRRPRRKQTKRAAR